MAKKVTPPETPPSTIRSQHVTSDSYYMKLPQVLQRLGISKSAFYEGIKQHKFPEQAKFGRASRWLSTEINQVMENALNGK